MGSQKRLIVLVIALFMVGLLLSACERPFQTGTQISTPSDTGVGTDPTPTETPAVAVTVDGEAMTPVEGEATPTDTSPRTETETPAAGETPTEGETPVAGVTETPAGEPTEEGEMTPTTEAEVPAAGTPTVQPTAAGAQGDIVHTVSAGETLFRIGLRYGVSWIAIANYNSDITDPSRIYVGQRIVIPGSNASADSLTPVPTDGNTYVVKPGDTLFKIGQALGIDWRLIAEANGIVNPNYIVANTTLKIPSDEPGPTPEFTHRVQQGETLFIISLNYGVTWNAIAEANNIAAPYVIYPGQELVIPGSS